MSIGRKIAQMRTNLAAALGYTPVNKAGDTMSGNLRLEKNIAGDQALFTAVQNASGHSFDYAGFISNAVGVSGGLTAWSTGSVRGDQMWLSINEAKPLVLGTADIGRVFVDGSGRVALPYQPAFRMNHSSNNYGTSSGWLAISGFTADYNIGSHFNASTGVFTAPVSGRYLFTHEFRGMDGSAYTNGLTVIVQKNNANYTTDLWGTPSVTVDGTSRNFVTGAVVMYMNANDTARYVCQGYMLQGGVSGAFLG